jgi:dTDP-4-amino-4,6-dideoxygalactose transaminase
MTTKEMFNIPFNRPYISGKELINIAEAHLNGKISGDGAFTMRSQHLLEKLTSSKKALLTHSCTAALEMSAILAGISDGDEVIMPSYTFVSTANAFVLRGAVPVFVDIRADTLNIDESLIERAITPRTRAIVVVHYAGIACEMDDIMTIAKKHNLIVIEDAAQAIMSSYKGVALGGIGNFGCFSFHETKNIISGEGGALLIRDNDGVSRAEIIREKGTDRSLFLSGHVDKYTWRDIGSSYLPGEIISAFLFAQLEQAESITSSRLSIWNEYHNNLTDLENMGYITRPTVPPNCTHNGHMYYIITDSSDERGRILNYLQAAGVNAVFHYIPLHNSPAGLKFGRSTGSMEKTINLSERIIRLPMWIGVDVHRVLEVLRGAVLA